MTRKVFGETAQVVGQPQKKPCDACGDTRRVEVQVIAGNYCTVCVDFHSCTERYRMGMTPESYQVYLKARHTLALSMAR
jgi:hypothetical protein